MGGTIGQHDTTTLAGGVYQLQAGFWGLDPIFSLYLPLLLKR